jgi:hypothetical protein
MDKIDSPVIAVLKFFQNGGVENKDGQYGQTRLQGCGKSGLVIQAQVAAEPEDVDGGLHGLETVFVAFGFNFGRLNPEGICFE